MSAVIEGILDASGKRFALVAGRFNELITRKLVEGAVDCLVRHHADKKDIATVWVPGAFEIPLAAQRLARSKNYDAIVCLGAVIRGSTPHFDYVAAEVSKGIAKVMLSDDLPVSFGVLTADTIEQAIERAGTKAGNKGWDAALSAVEMVDLLAKLP
jgi:6,7-dimethyl-8-ribityllumazine synthase